MRRQHFDSVCQWMYHEKIVLFYWIYQKYIKYPNGMDECRESLFEFTFMLRHLYVRTIKIYRSALNSKNHHELNEWMKREKRKEKWKKKWKKKKRINPKVGFNYNQMIRCGWWIVESMPEIWVVLLSKDFPSLKYASDIYILLSLLPILLRRFILQILMIAIFSFFSSFFFFFQFSWKLKVKLTTVR